MMRFRTLITFLLLASLCTRVLAAGVPPLQPLIDRAKPGDTLIPPPGTYLGPVVIDKPITLDGQGKVTLDGDGKGTVLSIETDGAQVRNLRVVNSGDHHDGVDAGIRIQGNFNIVKDNRLEDVLFGIVLHQSESAIIRRNEVRSKRVPLAQRGDGLRVWYSFGSKISDNRFIDTRDVIILNSEDIDFTGNRVSGGRYSLHMLHTNDVRVRNNRFVGNSAGLFTLKCEDLVIENNLVSDTLEITGIGIGLKESSLAVIRNNRVLRTSIGLALNLSPEEEGLTNRVEDNLVAYNAIGVQFLNNRGGNELIGNRFHDNYLPVVVENGESALKNRWEGNHWSDYEGFDRDRNRIGDTPYQNLAYADRLLMDRPYTRFFMAAPSFNLLDFLERLAPFSDPLKVVEDPRPMLDWRR